MKFKFIIKNSIKTAVIVFAVIILVGAGFTLANLILNGTSAFPVISLVFAFIVLILIFALLFNTYYHFRENDLTICLGVMLERIKYTDILEIKNYTKAKELFVIYRPKNPKEKDNLAQILVNIKPENYADFTETLLSKNGAIVYDEINVMLDEDKSNG